MTKYLHITNGDGAGNILKGSTLKGDVLPWRDTMHYGPFPSNLSLTQASKIRADYLAQDNALATDAVLRDFELRDKQLNTACRYDEVILWFEHDLLDQLQILQLLDWFNGEKERSYKLSLICIDRFEGKDNFRGLGELEAEQMASLFDYRQAVSQEQLSIAVKGWSAFRSANPHDLESFIRSNSKSLPFLKAALNRHLREYPWLSDGLSQTQRQLLQLVKQGVTTPGKLFVANMELESVLYLGDWQTFSQLEKLSKYEPPLLLCQPDQTFIHPMHNQISFEQFLQQLLALTPLGEKVVLGEIDANQLIQRDEWLGGVHLESGKSMWLWDEKNQRLLAQ